MRRYFAPVFFQLFFQSRDLGMALIDAFLDCQLFLCRVFDDVGQSTAVRPISGGLLAPAAVLESRRFSHSGAVREPLHDT